MARDDERKKKEKRISYESLFAIRRTYRSTAGDWRGRCVGTIAPDDNNSVAFSVRRTFSRGPYAETSNGYFTKRTNTAKKRKIRPSITRGGYLSLHARADGWVVRVEVRRQKRG